VAKLGARAAPLQAQDHVVLENGGARCSLCGAQHPAHAIAVDRERERFFRDHETEAARWVRGRRGDELNVVAFPSAPRLEERVERACSGEPERT
jgi:hypothetical protein